FDNDPASTELYTLSLHDALPISDGATIEVRDPHDGSLLTSVAEAREVDVDRAVAAATAAFGTWRDHSAEQRGRLLLKLADAIERSEEHTSELQSLAYLVCRLLLE